MTDFDTSIDRSGTGSLKWDRYKGRDIVPLWVADMDFKSPPAVIDAIKARADHGVFGYTIPYDEANTAVVDYLKDRHGIAVEKEWILWLPGLVQGLNLACRAVGSPGDSVLTCVPVYPPFLSAPGFSDRKRVTVPLRLDGTRWTFDWPALEQAVTRDTKLFILCNPHNPVGRVWSTEDLTRLVDFCERHNLILCSDEIHCDLILDDAKHVPTLALGEKASKRTIALYSPSKTYNQPGLACAYAIIPNPELRSAFQHVSRGIITEINCFGYAGCIAAYRHGEPWRKDLITYLRGNRDRVYEVLSPLAPRIKLWPMESTYLAWMDVRGLNEKHPHKFFEEHGVGLSNGVDFGTPGFLRINFGCPRSILEEGLTRIVKAVASLPL